MHDFATHEKEIDDIDFSPDSARLLSISKDKVSLDAVGSCFTISLTFQRAIVWDVKKGKKHAELGWESPAGVKYCFKVKSHLNSSGKVHSHNPIFLLSSTFCSEGQVWLCGGGPEEVQGVHHQQSSWVKQGGTRIDESNQTDNFSM